MSAHISLPPPKKKKFQYLVLGLITEPHWSRLHIQFSFEHRPVMQKLALNKCVHSKDEGKNVAGDRANRVFHLWRH